MPLWPFILRGSTVYLGVKKAAYVCSVVCVFLQRRDLENNSCWLAVVLNDDSGHVLTHAQNSLAMVQPGIRKDELVNVTAQINVQFLFKLKHVHSD